MNIKITQNDIDKAYPLSCTANPIGFAVQRLLGGDMPFVTIREVQGIKIDNVEYFSLIPQDAQEKIARFDAWKIIEPFSMVLEIQEFRRHNYH